MLVAEQIVARLVERLCTGVACTSEAEAIAHGRGSSLLLRPTGRSPSLTIFNFGSLERVTAGLGCGMPEA